MSNSRLSELLDIVKQEFDSISSNGVMIKEQRDEFENKLSAQINEINTLKQSFLDLKNLHTDIVNSYQEEISRLRLELDNRQSNSNNSTRPPTPNKSNQLPPPSLFSNQQKPFQQREFQREQQPQQQPQQLQQPQQPQQPQQHPQHSSQSPLPINTQLHSIKRSQSPYPSHSVQQQQQQHSQQQPQPLHHLPPPDHPPQPPQNSLKPINHSIQTDFTDVDSFPNEFRKDGSDWLAIYNPQLKRNMDVSLIHNLVHESVVCCVRFSTDGQFLATGCNKTAQIYDTKTGAKVSVLVDDNVPIKGDLYIRSVCFSPDSKFLATGAEDKQIRVWDIQKKKIKSLFTGHNQEIYSLDFSSDGKFIASGSGDKTARLWDVESNTCLHTFDIQDIIMCDTGPIDSGVTSVAISPDNRMVAAGSLDTKVRVWDVKTGNQLERLTGHKDSVYSVAFSPDGKSLISGSLDRTLKIWDLSGTTSAINGGNPPPVKNEINGEKTGYAVCINTLVGHKDYVLSVAVSPDGKYIVSGSKDRGVQFWDPNTAQTQLMLQGHKNSVISIDLSARGQLLATGSGDYHARICGY
ncbi:hypothetical protein E3P84_02536 [Wallemia ichthyophaga]|nr:hypothetical protein E3P91_01496 [Wallemia ichthyophaga]TIA81457.1 hypothetical protein E3P98_02026 [Wallemia ichthyophaga]TIA99247.1 hypothetical protein E3P94_02649 [Wallemia ichthyophaga]TIB32487.1 hypothetical protein E3P84_02536 [Wallemia ichthyophaga]TIB41007.1 hypothetical protein E3P83_02424 [Wallemia ichthyophaga]